MRYSPNAKIAPQRHSSSGRAIGAPASGGVKGRAMDPPVADSFRSVLHKRLGQLARGKPWKTVGYGSMAATSVPGGGSVVREGSKTAPSRGQPMTAASRNGEDTGVVGPSLVLNPRGIDHADTPVQVRRGRGLEAHKGRRAPSFVAEGGRRARQSY